MLHCDLLLHYHRYCVTDHGTTFNIIITLNQLSSPLHHSYCTDSSSNTCGLSYNKWSPPPPPKKAVPPDCPWHCAWSPWTVYGTIDSPRGTIHSTSHSPPLLYLVPPTRSRISNKFRWISNLGIIGKHTQSYSEMAYNQNLLVASYSYHKTKQLSCPPMLPVVLEYREHDTTLCTGSTPPSLFLVVLPFCTHKIL